MTLRAEYNGVPVERGAKVKNFRGDTRYFLYASRAKRLGKSAKVILSCDSDPDNGGNEYYATVIPGLEVIEE